MNARRFQLTKIDHRKPMIDKINRLISIGSPIDENRYSSHVCLSKG